MRKRMKGIFIFVMLCCIATGCNGKTVTTEEASVVEIEEQIVDSSKLNDIAGDYDEFTFNEIKGSYERLIINDDMVKRLNEAVTTNEWAEMVKNAANYLSIDVQTELSEFEANENVITRVDAGRNTVKVFYNNIFINVSRNDVASRSLSPDDAAILGNMDADENLWWANATIDFTSNTSMLDLDEHYSIRPEDNMTVLECARMLYRLTNFHIPEDNYVAYADVPEFVLSDELLSKAEAMPDVTEDCFSFKGVITDNKETDGSHPNIMTSLWYSENQVKLIHDMGFNFTRASLFYGLFFSDDGKVNLAHIENMDEMVKWCIENEVHVCFSLFDYPPDNNLDVDSYKEFWIMLAKHYQNVPNNVLSFNLINEPYGNYEGDDKDAKIEAITTELVDAVKAVDENRLIFMDSITGDETTVWGGTDRKPSLTLSEKEGVQTVHCYYGPFNGDALTSSGGYPSENMWPFPYVHCVLDEGSPVTINGNFTTGEIVTVRARFVYDDADTIHVSLDGKEIGSLQVKDSVSYDNDISKCYEFTLPTDGKTITISMNGFMQLFTIEIEHNEDADEPIPYQKPYVGDIFPTERNSNKVITNIQCMWNMTNTDAAQTITVDDDGTYTAATIPGWSLACVDFGYAGIKDYFKQWEDFKQKTGQNYMVMELGFYFYVNTPIELRTQYLDEFLTVLDENGVSWNTIDREWLYQFIYSVDTEKSEWIQMDGFWVNKTLLDVYQKHM